MESQGMERSWHGMSAAEAAETLGVDPLVGLASTEATLRLQEHGANVLAVDTGHRWWQLLLRQFASLIIAVLAVAAVVALSIGAWRDAIVIVSVLFINGLLGFYQEFRAERSLLALRNMLPARAKVRRDGQLVEISAAEVVPGDILILEAGDKVAADGRLYVATSLDVDESTLTGESRAVHKDDAQLENAKLPLAQLRNCVFMNSHVTRGRAEVVITETGLRTHIGGVSAALAQATQPPTPLQEQLDKLGRRLATIAGILVAALFVLQWLRGEALSHVVISTLALAVAAMPEGLPAVVTVTLALGMHRMANRQAIVKRLISVETLGCTTVICTDKTGTLTVNAMTVRHAWFGHSFWRVTGDGYEAAGAVELASGGPVGADMWPILVLPAVACNDADLNGSAVVGDPMEAALLVFARKTGLDAAQIRRQWHRIAELPFTPVARYMATLNRGPEGQLELFVKGALEVVLPRCVQQWTPAGSEPLDERRRALWLQRAAQLAEQGERVLVIAKRSVAGQPEMFGQELESMVTDLVLVGMVAMTDPLRSEAASAIAQCRQAGIAVKMITGDHPATAKAIAMQVGLTGEVLTGADLDRMNPAELAGMVDGVAVFARATPEHKVKIVAALRQKGQVVAMTGDGVNDAPALKFAHIGVAMGRSGTAVAREAADMVLSDDNFATIVTAVAEGRTLYENILKFVRFQLSTTLGAILILFLAPVLGMPDPLNPVQILWVAIIMDGPPAVSLALDVARQSVLESPPRHPSEAILSWPRLRKVLEFAAVMTIGTLGMLAYGLATMDAAQALTITFTTFVLFQVFNVFNARNELESALNRRLFHNPLLWISIGTVVVLQVAAVQWGPLQSIFRTVALTGDQWLLAVAVAASILLVEELRKRAVGRSGGGAR